MSMNKIKKRKRKEKRPTTHPRNKYSENPPDFAYLASLYPSFQPFGFVSRDGRPRIDWTDFNATRELTWILLLHDHRLNWWYTSMVGRKLNFKILTSKLWEVGVTMVKTTEFVQGQTSRWGLAWSFLPPAKKLLSSHVAVKNNLSFMLEGLDCKFGAIHVLESTKSFFSCSGASCNLNTSSFTVDITMTKDHSDAILKGESQDCDRVISCEDKQEASTSSSLSAKQRDTSGERLTTAER